MSKVEIVPAILPSSFAEIQEKLVFVKDVAHTVQIDLVDGVYAKSKTWPYKDRATFDKLVAEEHGLPFWEKLEFQFDLMVEDPMPDLVNFITAGATYVVLHAHSQNVGAALQTLVDRRTNDEMGSYMVHAGVALRPNDQLDLLEPFEAQFDFAQVMGIEREGHQGEPFDERAVFLVERIRRRYPHLPIQVDGGVTIENVQRLVGAGATRLIAGSAIFGSDDPAGAYQALLAEANK